MQQTTQNVCNMDGDEARQGKTLKTVFDPSYSHIPLHSRTHSGKDVVWVMSQVTHITEKALFTKLDQDLNPDVIISLDAAPDIGAFAVSPDGASLFFSIVSGELLIYWLDTQSKSINGALYDSAGNFGSEYSIVANTDSSSIYYNSHTSGIQKV